MILLGETIMNIIPTVVEKSNNQEYAYDLYSRLLKDRIVFLSGEIKEATANIIISELLYLDSLSHDDISLYINSPGGEVSSGLAIYDTMQFIKSNVHTIVVGMAASMAAIILASGDKRSSLKNADIMIHQPLGGINGQATDIKIVADHIIKTKKKLIKILADKTKKTASKLEADMERDYYMDAKEALNYGIIDEIL
jgi:ATP-dependent Clp protease protease subunit